MITVVDITIPAESFALGRIFTDHSTVQIELERLAPLHKAVIMPQFWVANDEDDAIATTLNDDPLVDNVETLTNTDSNVERTLYEIQWNPDVNGLVQSLIEADAKILVAKGTAEEWQFQLQFKNHSGLASFRKSLQEYGIQITLNTVFNPMVHEEDELLTAEQSDALITAYEEGYYEVPRGISQDELGSLLGISGNSVSQRLRRGTVRLIKEAYESGEFRL
ncbi:helix-turn-helix domain-containing protein [Natrinema soli]|uniref:Helix-turn-helix domain-containing protein n=1 Tax=Natrinema soli TaxID=1930624 RepID=A0ABD5SJR8_9EURY|nr:helix-turn-helix domain-containing protein [Natrinema soli]